jgi:hypothetical protein
MKRGVSNGQASPLTSNNSADGTVSGHGVVGAWRTGVIENWGLSRAWRPRPAVRGGRHRAT